jgi:hypothetical protein
MSIPASNARANLFRLIEQVNEDKEPDGEDGLLQILFKMAMSKGITLERTR